MKVAITGHRSYADRISFCGQLDTIHKAKPITSVTVTHTCGACRIAKEWCERNGVVLEQMRLDRSYTPRTGARRQNIEIVEVQRPDLIITAGEGLNSRDIWLRARTAGIEVLDIKI